MATRSSSTSQVLRGPRALVARSVFIAAGALLPAPGSLQAAQGPDFDGDGFDDLAVGVPFESPGGILAGGIVQVLYGSGGGVSVVGDQLWTQNQPGIPDAMQSQDQFGKSLAWGDFDGDGFDDLAVGAPGETLPGHGSAGVVHVLYGSASGLSAAGNQLWHQDSPGISDQVETDDFFGWALGAGDFDGDGRDDLAIGVPDEGLLDGPELAGVVHVLYGSPGGLTAAGSQRFSQDSPGILETAQEFDLFGSPLAAGDFDADGFADLAVGVNAEDVGAVVDAGAVQVLYGGSSGLSAAGDQLWTQSNTGTETSEEDDRFGSALAVGDFDGDGAHDLAAGTGVEDLPCRGIGCSPPVRAGMVSVLYGGPGSGLSSAGAQLWTQSSTDVQGQAETDDFFGSALAAGDFDGNGRDDLAIGTAGEDLQFFGTIGDAGMVNVLYGTAAGLAAAGNQALSQLFGLEGSAEEGDLFGSALTAGDFDGDGFGDVVAGTPFEDLGDLDFENHGAVNVVYGSADGGLSPTGNQFLHQDTPGVQQNASSGDNFGTTLP